MYKAIIFFIFFSVWHCALGQDSSPDTGSYLLYYIDDNSEEFMIPAIEGELINLNNPIANQHIFNKVSNLKEFEFQAISTNEFVDKLFLNKNYTYKTNLVSNLKGIDQYKFFLKINIRIFKNLLEISFYLYNVKYNQDSSLQLSYLKSSSTFIDPASNNYDCNLKMALAKIFNNANNKPKCSIYLNGSDVSNSKVYLTNNDSLILKLIASDYDCASEKLSLHWFQDDKDVYKRPLISNGITQPIIGFPPGIYHLKAYANDGVENSETISITLIVSAKPFLKIIPSKEVRYWYLQNSISGQRSFSGDNNTYNFTFEFNKLEKKRNQINGLIDISIIDQKGKYYFLDTLSIRDSIARPMNWLRYKLTQADNNSYLSNIHSGHLVLTAKYRLDSGGIGSTSVGIDAKIYRSTSFGFSYQYFMRNKEYTLPQKFGVQLGGEFALSSLYFSTIYIGTGLNDYFGKYFNLDVGIGAKVLYDKLDFRWSVLSFKAQENNKTNIALGLNTRFYPISSTNSIYISLSYYWYQSKSPSIENKGIFCLTYGGAFKLTK